MENYGQFIWDFQSSCVPPLIVCFMLYLILDWCRSILFNR